MDSWRTKWNQGDRLEEATIRVIQSRGEGVCWQVGMETSREGIEVSVFLGPCGWVPFSAQHLQKSGLNLDLSSLCPGVHSLMPAPQKNPVFLTLTMTISCLNSLEQCYPIEIEMWATYVTLSLLVRLILGCTPQAWKAQLQDRRKSSESATETSMV